MFSSDTTTNVSPETTAFTINLNSLLSTAHSWGNVVCLSAISRARESTFVRSTSSMRNASESGALSPLRNTPAYMSDGTDAVGLPNPSDMAGSGLARGCATSYVGKNTPMAPRTVAATQRRSRTKSERNKSSFTREQEVRELKSSLAGRAAMTLPLCAIG